MRVTDVAPDGTSRELTNGLQAASFRALDEDRSRVVDGWMLQPYHPFTEASVAPMPAGEAVPVDVEVFPTSAVVAPGHRIRVSVGAADFPHAVSPLPRLPDTLTSTTTVLHGPDTPSRVVLPVVGVAGDHHGAPAPADPPTTDTAPDVAPEAAPAPSSTPLPATGGGAGLLALLALIGARGQSFRRTCQWAVASHTTSPDASRRVTGIANRATPSASSAARALSASSNTASASIGPRATFR